jgi:hypothetical protein
MKRLAPTIVALGLVLAACSKGGTGATTPTPSISHRPSTTGTIAIISPKPGEAVKGPNVTVVAKLTGARLVKAAVAKVTPDTGHLHVRVDGKTLTILAGLKYVTPPIAKGQHILEVEFVAGDHAPFYPDVVQRVTFRVT